MKAKDSFNKTQYKAGIDIKMERLNFVHKKAYFPRHKLKMKILIIFETNSKCKIHKFQ